MKLLDLLCALGLTRAAPARTARCVGHFRPTIYQLWISTADVINPTSSVAAVWIVSRC